MIAHAIQASAGQAWPPFVLVAGLLLIGTVAASDGLFEAIGGRLARTRLGERSLLLALLALVAMVTAVLNLDTSVVFLTPVLVHAARGRQLDERPFLYGSVFMANAASLLLPGSNLTNLLVLESDPQPGAAYALRMLPAWLAACTITALFVAIAFRLEHGAHVDGDCPPVQLGLGAVATVAAAALVVALPNAALPIFAVGLAAIALRRLRPQLNVRFLLFLFALAVAVGTIGRLWHYPANLLDSSGTWAATALGAGASVLMNNLPAAVLLSAGPATHPDALLLGLDLGPNLAVTGSLSAVLWLQAARSVGAHASIATYSRFGLVLVPLTLVAAVLAMLAASCS
jgi:arsenical pump membrane protein